MARWQVVQAMQNDLLRGVGLGNCDEKKSTKLLLDKKKIHTNITRKENHKGLKKIYFERSVTTNKFNSCLTRITHPSLVNP